MVEFENLWVVLDRRVIVVARKGACNDWAAYIGAVPGENHDKEWREVRDHGSKIPEDVARVLFPEFDGVSWRP